MSRFRPKQLDYIEQLNQLETDMQAQVQLAMDWATKVSAEVVAGQGYGAKKYAMDAAASAASLTPSSLTPVALGTAAKGTDTNFARGDHVHPSTGTTQAVGTNNTQYATTAFVQATFGSTLAKTVTTADVTLAAQEALYPFLNLTGALTGNRAVIVPASSRTWLVRNNTSGGFTLTVKTSAGTGVTVAQGKDAWLYCDGTNVVKTGTDMAGVSISGMTGGTVNGNLTLSNTTPELRLLSGNAAVEGQQSRILFDSEDLQGVMLRHNTYDSTQAPFGLHLEASPTNVSGLQPYFKVGGTVYANTFSGTTGTFSGSTTVSGTGVFGGSTVQVWTNSTHAGSAQVTAHSGTEANYSLKETAGANGMRAKFFAKNDVWGLWHDASSLQPFIIGGYTSEWLRINGTGASFAGNVTVSGNLIVNGTTTTVNSTTVTVDDPIFTLGGDTAPASDDNKDRGIEFRWHNGTAAKVGFFGFDDSTGKFTFIPDATNTNEVFTGTAGTIVATLEGNASTATDLVTATADNYMKYRGAVADSSVDTATANGFYTLTAGSNKALLAFSTVGSVGPLQMRFTWDGTMEWRNKTDSTTWTSWKTVYHSGNTVPATNGGTGQTAFTIGDILYASSTTALSKLAAGAAKQVFQANGAGVAPSWVTLDMSFLPDAAFKKSVKAATTANLAATMTGNVMTASAVGALPAQDGVTLALNDRVLVKNQTSAQHNGIFYVSNLGSASVAWTMTRALDADTASEIAGAVVVIDQGTTNGGEVYTTHFKTTDTLGTTAMTWYRVYDANDSATTSSANKLVLRDGNGDFSARNISMASLYASSTAFLNGATGPYTGYASGVTLNYTGSGTQHGITFKPTASTADALAFAFLSSASTYATPVLMAAIRHLSGDAGMNMTGTWNYAGSELFTKAGGTLTGALTVNTGTTVGTSLNITNTGTSGAQIAMTGQGATTPTKYLRVFNGVLEVVNSANSAVIFSITDAGNVWAAGTSSFTSDETVKGNWRPLPKNFVTEWAKLQCGKYDRLDTGETQVGVSAQGVQKIVSELVTLDREGKLAMAYGNAGTVASVELAKEAVAVRKMLRKIMKRLDVLEAVA